MKKLIILMLFINSFCLLTAQQKKSKAISLQGGYEEHGFYVSTNYDIF